MISTRLRHFYDHCALTFPIRLEAWIVAAYWLFTAMQFVVASGFVYSFWFYLAVMAPFLLGEWRSGGFYTREIWRHPVGRLVLMLLGYTVIHALFLTEGWVGLGNTLFHTFCTAVFMGVSVLALRLPQPLFSKLLVSMIYLVTIMAVAAVAWHVGYIGTTRRLEPFGRTHHAILGANVFAVFALSSLYLAHPDTPERRRLFLPALVCTVVAVLIAFTESRGPMLSFAGAGVVALLLVRQYIPLLALLIMAGMVVLDGVGYAAHHHAYLPLTPLYEALTHLQQRPSHRGGIWEMAVGLIVQKPLLGYGMMAPFSYGYGGVNPHNIFLSAFFYTGIIGGGLLLAIIATALTMSWRQRRTPAGALTFTLLVHAVLACMTDQGQYVHSPAPQWTIFWWPVALAIAFITPYKAVLKS